MKFNWRGEPLLNQAIFEIINYAKSSGFLKLLLIQMLQNLMKRHQKL